DAEPEVDTHRRAEWRDSGFAAHHIPRLVRAFTPPPADCPSYAILYEIAGRSLDSFVAADLPESPGFIDVCGHPTKEMLTTFEEPASRRPSRWQLPDPPARSRS